MRPSCTQNCQGYDDRVICRCLGVTEATLVEVIATLELRTIKEVGQHTGAGDGCTCCHRLLAQYLDQHAEASRLPLSKAC
jgi:bacterioferritin-associated ferredoxin